MDKVYKRVGNEVWVIPIREPPSHQFLKEKAIIPHQNEPINQEGLAKLRELKHPFLGRVDLTPST